MRQATKLALNIIMWIASAYLLYVCTVMLMCG